MEIQVVVAERKKHVDLMKERPNGKRKQKVHSGKNDGEYHWKMMRKERRLKRMSNICGMTRKRRGSLTLKELE